MQYNLHQDLAIRTFPAVIWQRRPKNKVPIQSKQGDQFSGDDWIFFCTDKI